VPKELYSVRDRLNRLFEDAQAFSGEVESCTWMPVVDFYETRDRFVVQADVPDVQESDITIRIDNGVLKIRGERKLKREGRSYHQIERCFGFFTRSFPLPTDVDKDAIKAHLQDGILRITIPKKTPVVLRQIDIK
jgi:HSP20 family protein